MSSNELLDKLEKAAKEYLQRERDVLNAQYNFLDQILRARGYSKLSDHNSAKAQELLIKSIQDFLNSTS